jgi:deoxyribonucleoside regulator
MNIDDQLLFRVAEDYYVKDKYQREIAEELGVSRVQISKYLKMAKDRGIIRVEVIAPQLSDDQQSFYVEKFRSHFSIERVLIAPNCSHEGALRARLSALAESYVLGNLGEDETTVGLGWGHSVCDFAENLQRYKRPSWRIVPLAGGSTFASSKYYNTNHIVHVFAEKLEAQAVLLYLPFLMEPDKYRDSRSFSEEYDRVYSIWDQLDLVACGVGNPRNLIRSPYFRSEVIKDYIDEMEQQRVVGDLLTHCFDIDGRYVRCGIEDRMVNVDFEQVRRAKKKLIITFGDDRIEALIGAMNAHLIDVLVTDQSTVDGILARSS